MDLSINHGARNMVKKLAVIVGSLRENSLNRKIATELVALAPQTIAPKFIEIGELPLYNQDLDDQGRTPSAWSTFRKQIKESDALLFVTPEYNRSIPGVLKNAIDVGSRPAGQNAWGGKPGAVVSASPGSIGGFGANHHLRQSLSCLNVFTLSQPEAYISQVASLFNAEGTLINEDTRQFLTKFMNAFASWITTHTGNGAL
jgi:chromate reductase